jgi:serine/threonine protein kinase
MPLDQDVDARSDCYSLACVLYETITGKPPLSARTAFETMNKQLSMMPDGLTRVRPDLVFPKQLEKIIFKAMAKSPARRYQNIVEFMDELLKLSGEKTHSNQHDVVAVEQPRLDIKRLSQAKKTIKTSVKYTGLTFFSSARTYP